MDPSNESIEEMPKMPYEPFVPFESFDFAENRECITNTSTQTICGSAESQRTFDRSAEETSTTSWSKPPRPVPKETFKVKRNNGRQWKL